MDRKTALDSMRIYPCPSREELLRNPFDPDWVKAAPLLDEDINEDFSNISDLGWLDSPARDNRVMVIGEYHWRRATQHLQNRLIFALETFDYFPLLLTELCYSNTPFLDHYIFIRDDSEAKAFFSEVISEMATYDETAELLYHLRRWNLRHPSKQIHIGCRDIDHDIRGTLDRVVLPFLRKLRPELNVDLERLCQADIETFLDEIHGMIPKAREMHLAGDLPFITCDFVENVIESLRWKIWSRMHDLFYFRQKGIVHHLTAERFFGRPLAEGKVILLGGAHHTPSRMRIPQDGEFLKESSYLSFKHSPTCGKTYSVVILGEACCIGGMADFDLPSGVLCADAYRRQMGFMQEAVRQGYITADQQCFVGESREEYSQLLLRKSLDLGGSPLHIISTDWNSILKKARELPASHESEIRWDRSQDGLHDQIIFVPYSEVFRLRRHPTSEQRS
jgi:hypothetical protein